jgi:hypothetical protein
MMLPTTIIQTSFLPSSSYCSISLASIAVVVVLAAGWLWNWRPSALVSMEQERTANIRSSSFKRKFYGQYYYVLFACIFTIVVV